jgi:transcriptional regulator with XRE-family HTH domain
VGVPVALGELLRSLRTEAGLTQEELAEAAGISTRSVSDLERGVNLTARKDTAWSQRPAPERLWVFMRSAG